MWRPRGVVAVFLDLVGTGARWAACGARVAFVSLWEEPQTKESRRGGTPAARLSGSGRD
jgi:hypothetical protein